MELETPVDGWYVWVAVALVSVGFAAVALHLPAEPPPDADRAAGALDRVGAAGYDAATTVDHDADAVRVGPERIAMRSDGGTSRARVSFGPVVPVSALDLNATERTALEGVLAGERAPPESLEASLEAALEGWTATAGEWRPSDGTLRARGVTLDKGRVVLVAG